MKSWKHFKVNYFGEPDPDDAWILEYYYYEDMYNDLKGRGLLTEEKYREIMHKIMEIVPPFSRSDAKIGII